MGPGWEAIARSNLHQFRFTALRYRHLPAFERLMEHLHEQPDFTRLWLETRENRIDLYSQHRLFEYHHAKFGPLHYATTMSSTLTPHGPLHMIIFVACDEQTQHMFNGLCVKNTGARPVIEWPNSDMTK